MFEPFEEVFLETASRETRSLLVKEPTEGSAEEPLLPAATYEFHELFCADPDCDCERVIFAVISADYLGGEVLAQIEMDLAPAPLHKRLLGAGNPRLLADPGKTEFEVSPENGRHAETLLRLFSDILAADRNYIDRVRRHQNLFREALAAREEEVYPMPDGRPPLDRKAVRDLAHLYTEARALSRSLHDGPLLAFQEPDQLSRSAARLGVLGHKKTIILDSEAEFGFLMELSFYGLRSSEGETLVQRYARTHCAEADEPTRRLLSAMTEARFALLQITSVIPELGAVVQDIWRNESGLLADKTLAKIGKNGAFLIGHYLRLPEFWMSTGATLGVSQEAALVTGAALQNRLSAASVSNVDALPPQDLEGLTAEIMRYLLTGQSPSMPRPPRPERPPGRKSGNKPSALKRRHRSR